MGRARLRLWPVLLLGAALSCRKEPGPPAPPPPGSRAARAPRAPRAIVDPRAIQFPAGLSPASREKLDQAIGLHLEALDLYLEDKAQAGNEKAAAALRAYEEAGALVAELGQLHHELVVRVFQAGQVRAAMQEAERWLARFPDSLEHLETLGIAEYKAGNVPAAARRLGRAAALAPASVVLQRRLAEVYSAQGSKEEALAAASAALRLIGYPEPRLWSDPEAEQTVRAALRTYHRFYDYAGLLPIADALLSRFPDDPAALTAGGVARGQLGRFAESEKMLRKVVDDPLNADEVRFELGLAISKQGRIPEAAAAFSELLERSPHFSRGYHQLGMCLSRLKRTGAAEAMSAMSRSLAQSERELRREVELRGAGRLAESHRARARALVLRGQVLEAEAALRSPKLRGSPAAAVYLVEFLMEALRAKEAEEVLRVTARQIGASHPDVMGWSGRALLLRGSHREAAALLEPPSRANLPSNPWPGVLGRLYLDELESPGEAVPWLERALGDPPHPAETAALARALVLSGNPGRARSLLEALSRGSPDWETEARLLLALAILRSSPAERGRAMELIAGARPETRGLRVYHLALAEGLASSPDPTERERAAAPRAEADRLLSVERRWRSVRSQAAALEWPKASALLIAASLIQEELGDRDESIRMARLAAAADPASAEAARHLARKLDGPGEVFYRLEAARRWRRLSPGDPEALALEAQAAKAIDMR